MSLSVEIYVRCGCGFRPVVSLLEYLNKIFDWQLEKIPTRNTIENWVKKCGYKIYQEPFPSLKQEGYAQIIDESMMLGSEKMLLSLGINAQKQCTGVLKRGDIKILDISVASRWNSQSIEEIFRQTERKVGSSPVYVVSDNDSKLVKAIGQSGYTHIRDISHTLALFSEGLYKHDEEFSTYSKCLSCVKIREVMRPASYLLPPRQRTIARFMNLSTTVEWSIKMQRCFGSLNKEEQDTFAFSNTHKTIINELSIIFEFINYAQSLIKTKGLSSQTIKLVLKKLNRKLNFQSKRIKLFNALVRDYLKAESGKLNSKKCIWNASSDIIESLFGTFKLIQGDASLAIGLLFAKKSGFHFE